MTSKMLIDASHPEETRVVVMRGNRVEEFDFESANRKQLRGNIYLAKVTRVEPSLQAAFIDYGGNRHGFLAFSEIHPDYYQIPVADRQALIAEEQRRHQDDEAEHERRSGRRNWRHRSRSARRPQEGLRSEPVEGEQPLSDMPATTELMPGDAALDQVEPALAAPPAEMDAAPIDTAEPAQEHVDPAEQTVSDASTESENAERADETSEPVEQIDAASEATAVAPAEGGNGDDHAEDESVESVGGADALEEAQERAPRVRVRQYKIQEVIKRRQVMLVQVVKEERGTKGAALTTYLSLAGRYCVLMPNTSRGGGISRKITSAEDRSRLKEIAGELEVPEGMGVILRTAGASRTKTEVKRDFEYLLRIWETVRDLTLKSSAPKLVYEEGSLTKRSIRDLYSKEIDEIIVAGEEGYNDAKEFMRMLMPSHAKNVKLYRDNQPLFTRFGIESQLDAMFTPTVQLRSGGYIVINQAEALVAIDVNSGRATREHSIEDTAVKTNSEAAEEIARQLRLRDLAGLIVIDFIDMDERRNNNTVERRMKDALKHDRARIQVGRISHFGLLEMSRQRIRTSVLESSTEKCPICGGSGHVRSVSSVTLALLRAIEETLIKGATHNLIVRTRSEVALYVLNQKRSHLRALEERFRITITVSADPTVVGNQAFTVDRGEQVHSVEAARELAASQPVPLAPIEEDATDDYVEPEESPEESETIESEPPAPVSAEAEPDGEQPRRRRRRGGRGRNSEGRDSRNQHQPQLANDASAESSVAQEDSAEPAEQNSVGFSGGPGGDNNDNSDGTRRKRRRGRRGGRRHRRNGENGHQPRPYGQDGGSVDADQGAMNASVSPDHPYEPQQQPRHVPDGSKAEPAPRPAEFAQQPAPSPADNTGEETPRRGSTVRETFNPARQAAGAASATPVVSSSGEEPAAPKRGWWGRRILGDKG